MRILVADDDRVVSTLVCATLRKQGYQVTPVFDAMQAVMFAQRPPPPDLILLDLNMPGGTGVEALKRIKASVRTSTIPVIVLSGTTDPSMAIKVKELGADAFLGKPVDAVQLIETIARALKPA